MVAIVTPGDDMKEMDERCGKATLAKKEKKHKRKKRELIEPEQVDGDKDDKSLKRVKKEKKREKTKHEGSPSRHGSGEKPDGEKKHKKKMVDASDDNAKPMAIHDECIGKQRRRSGEGNGLEASQNSLSVEEMAEKKWKKHKKMKDKSVQSKPAEYVKQEKRVGEGVSSKAKKRKSKALVLDPEESGIHSEENEKRTKMEETRTTPVIKKEKTKKRKVDNQKVAVTLEGESGAVVKDMLKKKKKKKAMAEAIAVTKTAAGEAESQGVNRKAKKRKANVDGEDTLEYVPKKGKKGEEMTQGKTSKHLSSSGCAVMDEEGTKRKKKNAVKRVKIDISLQVEEDQDGSRKEDGRCRRRKKNKAKECELLPQQPAVNDVGQNTEAFFFVPGGSKSKGKKERNGSSEERIMAKKEKEEVSVSAKKTKRKIKLEEDDSEIQQTPGATPHMDVVFMSEKTGNRDEVNINQERRLALQMDIDNESHPPKPAKASGYGQWSTAQFDSSEKQQKFLRLMGGFKKETPTTSGPNAVRANMALAQDQQQSLHQALLGEFERAQSRRIDFNGRGAGLGFSVPSNKKFFIDANACRSTRFDD